MQILRKKSLQQKILLLSKSSCNYSVLIKSYKGLNLKTKFIENNVDQL